MKRLRVAKVTDKLKIIDLILLLLSTDGPLLSYMHVFRIMQNAQEKSVCGLLHLRDLMAQSHRHSWHG